VLTAAVAADALHAAAAAVAGHAPSSATEIAEFADDRSIEDAADQEMVPTVKVVAAPVDVLLDDKVKVLSPAVADERRSVIVDVSAASYQIPSTNEVPFTYECSSSPSSSKPDPAPYVDPVTPTMVIPALGTILIGTV
jgi:aminopeptidase N